MASRFAFRRAAVMTGGAAANDFCARAVQMIEHRAADETDRVGMAGLARRRGHDMAGRFAQRGHAIMAGGATGGDAGMVELRAGKSGGAGMAIVAWSGSLNVVGRLGCGLGAHPDGMATGTILGCALEQTTRMAGFTTHRGMHPGQREASPQMVEVGGDLSGRRGGSKRQNQ